MDGVNDIWNNGSGREEQKDTAEAIAGITEIKEFRPTGVAFANGRTAVLAGAIIVVIRTPAVCVLMGWVAVVVVIFPGGVVIVTAVGVCGSGVGKGNRATGQKQDAGENGNQIPFSHENTSLHRHHTTAVREAQGRAERG